ncbi:MoaD/ThiS family protein [Chloroflexota bacterium]
MKESVMTKVRVYFFGGFRGITGKGEDEIIVPKGATLRDFLFELVRKYGAPFEQLVWSSDSKLRPACQLFLEDEEVSPDDLNREVIGKVNLFFVAAVGGG